MLIRWRDSSADIKAVHANNVINPICRFEVSPTSVDVDIRCSISWSDGKIHQLYEVKSSNYLSVNNLPQPGLVRISPGVGGHGE